MHEPTALSTSRDPPTRRNTSYRKLCVQGKPMASNWIQIDHSEFERTATAFFVKFMRS
jgi:hypothetical protein